MKISNIQYPVSRGFTIIETLVAIMILMIAIAGPLVVASKGLSAALYARDQITATFLAQESMEVIKNQKDNNIDAVGAGGNDAWLNIMPSPDKCVSTLTSCDASAIFNPDDPRSKYSLGIASIKFDINSGYNHIGSGIPTIFKRYYYLTDALGTGPCAASNAECGVHVVVTWNEGSVPYEVYLDSEMVNVAR